MFYSYKHMILCTGEAEYENLNINYVEGSKRRWIVYCAATEDHRHTEVKGQVKNSIVKKVLKMNINHKEEKFNLVIEDSIRELEPSIQIANQKDDDELLKNKFGERFIAEIKFFADYIQEGKNTMNRQDLSILIKAEMIKIR